MRLTKLMLAAALTVLGAMSAPWISKSTVQAKADNDTANRLNAAADVVSDMMGAPDKGIPKDLLDKAACVVVVPSVKKAAFVIGAKYGRGFIVCRPAAPSTSFCPVSSLSGQTPRRQRDRLVVLLRPRPMRSCTPSCLPTRGRRDYSRAYHSMARLCDRMMTRIRTCTAGRCPTEISC